MILTLPTKDQLRLWCYDRTIARVHPWKPKFREV